MDADLCELIKRAVKGVGGKSRQKMDLKEVLEVFRKEDVVMVWQLGYMTQDDFRNMGISAGLRIWLQYLASCMQYSSSSTDRTCYE